MSTWAFIFPSIGTNELIVLGIVALIFFGNRLPSVMRSLGKGVTEFKKGISGVEDDLDKAVTADKKPEGQPQPTSPVERY